MQLRRGLMEIQNADIDYLENLQWKENAYISATGQYINGNVGTYTHYTIDQLVLPSGKYVLKGTHYQGSYNYRIHAYNANDIWIRQIMYATYNPGRPVSMEFTIDENIHGIRLSIGTYFIGTLKRV